MPQARKRRRRKHRGTQGGSIDRRRARGRPRSREEARAQARHRAEARRDRAPTWGGALTRGLFGAVVFFILAITLLGQPVGGAIVLSIVMLAIYVPLGYYIDRFFYNRRRRTAQAARAERARR